MSPMGGPVLPACRLKKTSLCREKNNRPISRLQKKKEKTQPKEHGRFKKEAHAIPGEEATGRHYSIPPEQA
jgi:hypothetical protein